MDFLRILEDIRFPALDAIMAGITQLGGESAFFLIALFVFWCISKRTGYFIMTAGYAGMLVNQFLKLAFRIERPWILDPDFTIVESARAEATGYSFPSGHSTNIISIAGALFLASGKKWFKAICAASIALVAFSRMYLGVHTPKDVTVGLAAGFATLIAVWTLFKAIDKSPKLMLLVIMGIVITSGIYLLYTELWPFSEGINAVNLESGRKNGGLMLGSALGLLAGYSIDARWVKFRVEAGLLAQAIKFALGLTLIIGIRVLTKEPLVTLLGTIAGTAVRYFIMILFATAIWPMTFKYIARIGGTAHDIPEY